MNNIISDVIKGFANIKTMDPSGPAYSKLCAILDRASDEALIAVHSAKINFASNLAFNRMLRRGLVKPD
jgi:hypothetical protein